MAFANMKITTETEFMENQKHADVMAPDLAFKVLQTPEGDALFFSIGTDHVLYVTREVQASNTGWTRVDLSSSLSKEYSNAIVTAKSFDLSQNAQTLAFDLALVVTVEGTDYLHLSLNNSNTADSWASGVTWASIPFDAPGVVAPNPLNLADVYIMNIPTLGGSTPIQNIFVDVVRTPGDPLRLLDRYYITPAVVPHWVHHNLAIDLKAGSISSCLGHRSGDYVPGIYTFGAINSTQELIYAPQSNPFRPSAPPEPARLSLPAGATAIASALNTNGDTNLFVATSGGLYVFTPDNQHDLAVPVLAVPPVTIGTAVIFAGVSELSASTLAGQTVVWAINAQGNLFQVHCPVGSEATPSAWSFPVPLLTGVEKFAFYINISAANNVVFAHLSGQGMVQLTQNPETSMWDQRNILLPPTAVDDVLTFNSFTTHAVLADVNGNGVPNSEVTIRSVSPVPVYINDVYYVLTPTVPISVTSDAVGTVTIIQQTDSLSAVAYKLTIPGPPVLTVPVDPLARATQVLSTIQSGDDLGNVQIETSNGSKKNLIPSDVDGDTKDSAASLISQLVMVKSKLPADGSKQTTTNAVAHDQAPVASPEVTPQFLGGVSIDQGKMKYYHGEAAGALLGHDTHHDSLLADDASISILLSAGDLWRLLKDGYEAVQSAAIKLAKDGYHFVVKIAGQVYNAILDSASAVMNGILFVFDQIKVAIEDLIAWLGFLFSWPDILRTHSVLKNVFKQYAIRAVNSLDTLEAAINNAFINIEDAINSWANLTDSGETIGVEEKADSTVPTITSPQSNWASYHAGNGISVATTSDPGSSPSVTPTLEAALADLEAAVTDEIDFIQTTVDQVKSQIVDQISSLTPVEVLKKMLAIISDFILNTARNITVKLVDVIKLALTGVLDFLDETIDIPILSSLYKFITGSDLSFLDLTSLIIAIPVTIWFKAIRGTAPFPDNSFTSSLIDAPDFNTITALVTGKHSSPSLAHGLSAAPLDHVFATASDIDAATAMTSICNFIAVFASYGVITLGVAKFTITSIPFLGEPPLALRRSLALIYIAYVAPDIAGIWSSPDSWATLTNDAVTTVSVAKTFLDNVGPVWDNSTWSKASPYLEALINFVWLVPGFGSYFETDDRPTSAKAMLVANIFFDLGGILTPGTAPERGPGLSGIFRILILALTAGYGASSGVAGGALLAGN